jgi:hypothetical protein
VRSGFKSQAGYAARVQVSGEVRASRQPDDRLLSKSVGSNPTLRTRCPSSNRRTPVSRAGSSSGVLHVAIRRKVHPVTSHGRNAAQRLMGNGVIGQHVWFWPRRVQVRALVPQLRRCAWCDCAFVRRMARFDSVHRLRVLVRLRAFRASARVFLVGTRCPGQHRGKAPCDRSVSGKHVTSPWSQGRFESGRSLSARVV